jgi:hypothetical protein
MSETKSAINKFRNIGTRNGRHAVHLVPVSVRGI